MGGNTRTSGTTEHNRDILITYRYHMGVPNKNNRQNSAMTDQNPKKPSF